MYEHVYIYIYMYMCMHMCMCMYRYKSIDLFARKGPAGSDSMQCSCTALPARSLNPDEGTLCNVSQHHSIVRDTSPA